MRFKIIFEGSCSIQNVDEIRKSFISFLKKTFERASEEKFNYLFSSKKLKPYVYSPFFGEKFNEDRIGPQISFIFSSGDNEIISLFWNGILQLKKEGQDDIILGGERFVLCDITLLSERKIVSNKVLFKTIGISVLTDPESLSSDFKNWYIIPEKENIEKFNKILNERVKQKYRIIQNKDIQAEVKFSFYEHNKEILIKETVIPIFNGYLRGFRGYFFLEGKPEILKFLYDYGFGVRTGQGFGLLEIVKQL